MELFRPDQIVVLGLFMAALAALWLFVHRHKQGLTEKFQRGRRLQQLECLNVSRTTSVTLLSVDGRSFLLVHGREGVSALHPLTPDAEGDQP